MIVKSSQITKEGYKARIAHLSFSSTLFSFYKNNFIRTRASNLLKLLDLNEKVTALE